MAVLVIAGTVFYIVHVRNGTIKDNTGRILEIRDTNSGKIYKRLYMNDGSEFAIEFIHSVHNSPVRETFRIEDTVIRPMEVRFSSFGAGMQSDMEEGLKLSQDGDTLIISGFSRSFSQMNYIVGTVSDHLLFFDEATFSLRELCGRNTHITIGITK